MLSLALVAAPLGGVSFGQNDAGGGAVNNTAARDDDDGFDYGWLGLIGLLGLAGLMRRKDTDRVHRTDRTV